MMTASKIQIRVFFDAGSGICFWAGNDAARTLYQEYPISPNKLPISVKLQSLVVSLIERYDTSIDWAYPPDPTPWTEAECHDFNKSTHDMIAQLTAELSIDYEIVNEFIPIQKNVEQGMSGNADLHPT